MSAQAEISNPTDLLSSVRVWMSVLHHDHGSRCRLKTLCHLGGQPCQTDSRSVGHGAVGPGFRSLLIWTIALPSQRRRRRWRSEAPGQCDKPPWRRRCQLTANATAHCSVVFAESQTIRQRSCRNSPDNTADWSSGVNRAERAISEEREGGRGDYGGGGFRQFRKSMNFKLVVCLPRLDRHAAVWL